MCDFLSVVEKGGKNYYLTHDLVYNTPRGKELQTWSENIEDDKLGHGAIRYYYNLKGGEDREYTDFSSPSNFPKEIAEAIKSGVFRGMGTPEGLLLGAKRKLLDDDYKAKCAPLYADYEAKCAPLDADYEAKRAPLYADYKAKRAPLYADYEAKRKLLDDDYMNKFWDLFANPKNRRKCWR